MLVNFELPLSSRHHKGKQVEIDLLEKYINIWNNTGWSCLPLWCRELSMMPFSGKTWVRQNSLSRFLATFSIPRSQSTYAKCGQWSHRKCQMKRRWECGSVVPNNLRNDLEMSVSYPPYRVDKLNQSISDCAAHTVQPVLQNWKSNTSNQPIFNYACSTGCVNGIDEWCKSIFKSPSTDLYPNVYSTLASFPPKSVK